MKNMKWRRKKSGSSLSASAASMIGSVFSVSWISKFKKKVGSLESSSVKEKQRGKVNFSTPNSSCLREGRFYSMDEDDPYWRLSFTEERIEGRRSTGVLMNPLWCDSDHDGRVRNSSFKSFSMRDLEGTREEERWNFNDMVLDIKKMKEKKLKKGVARELRSRNANGLNDQRPTKPKIERCQEEEVKTQKSVGKDIFEVGQSDMFQMGEEFLESTIRNSRKQDNIYFRKAGCLSSIEEDSTISESQNLEDKKNVKEIRKKRKCQGKSANISKDSSSRKMNQNNRFKVYSPRMECKIRALEDMKKSRMALKKKPRKEKGAEGGTMFDCYAVVKNSFNPQQDFRDSMVEMMIEKDIRQTEELEELLACYLTFNCDEYHDIIIKVFRQVWFQLNKG